jgi:hypothetical protein
MLLEKFFGVQTDKVKKILICGISFWCLFFVGGISFAFAAGDDYPAEQSGFASSPALAILLDILLLVGIIVCFVISARVKSFLRDGELASGWILFSLSFVLLFIGQLLNFSVDIRVAHISSSIISAVRLLSILSLASGIYFMKKVLS